MPRSTPLTAAALAAVACLVVLPSCRKSEDKSSSNSAPPEPFDLRTWKPAPGTPEPDISLKVEIVQDPKIKKISMKITASEANGLTVEQVHFRLRYRVYDQDKKEYTYPDKKWVPKMIPKIEKGHTVFQTAIVETFLQPEAWAGEDDNWDAVVTTVGGRYYKEE